MRTFRASSDKVSCFSSTPVLVLACGIRYLYKCIISETYRDPDMRKRSGFDGKGDWPEQWPPSLLPHNQRHQSSPFGPWEAQEWCQSHWPCKWTTPAQNEQMSERQSSKLHNLMQHFKTGLQEGNSPWRDPQWHPNSGLRSWHFVQDPEVQAEQRRDHPGSHAQFCPPGWGNQYKITNQYE